MNRQTGQPAPFQFCRHVQWKTWEQGIVIRPFVSSMRSKHTGQVGSSIKFGVGGGKGFRVLETVAEELEAGMSSDGWVGVSNAMSLTKTAWQI